MNNLLAALQFLTILPAGRPRLFLPEKMTPFFPVVGLLLGLTLAGVDWAAVQMWPRPAAAVLDVFFLVIVTGAFHLDGLGDTADGLYGNHPAEKALAIMKDSRIGAMGVVAIVSGLALKWAGLASLDGHRPWLLMIIPAYARASMVLGMMFLPYGRPAGGTGHGFFESPVDFRRLWGLLPVVVLSGLLGWTGLWLNVFFVLLVASTLLFYKHRIHCITGDMLGAMGEVCESGLFLLISIGGVA